MTDNLEETTLQMFENLDFRVDPNNIKNCYWLPGKSSKKVIVRFSRQKDVKNVHKSKKKLKGMNISGY